MVSNNLSSSTEMLKESKLLQWQKNDTVWMLSLYGTAIGAGVLFLPINAGMNGLWLLLIMAILAFPMTFLSHRALCRFVLSGASPNDDITSVVDEHFGLLAGRILTLLYFFAIYPILLMYSVAITNTTQSFLIHQLGIVPPPRIVLAVCLILGLMIIVRFGQQVIVKCMSALVFPFIAALMLLAIYLIPHWHNAVLQNLNSLPQTGQGKNFFMNVWLMIPVMVFSFNHSPIISSFSVSQRQRYDQVGITEKKSALILKYSHLMMVGTVMFFVFSCVFSLSSQDLILAKQQNISILSYLANHFHTPLISYAAPLIAFVAISKSFFGHYLGASEGLRALLLKSSVIKRAKFMNAKNSYIAIDFFMILTCSTVATLNPSILGMIETLGGPVIAMILFLMPMYAVYKVPAMKKYQSVIYDAFIIIMGIIAISGIIYGLWI